MLLVAVALHKLRDQRIGEIAALQSLGRSRVRLLPLRNRVSAFRDELAGIVPATASIGERDDGRAAEPHFPLPIVLPEFHDPASRPARINHELKTATVSVLAGFLLPNDA